MMTTNEIEELWLAKYEQNRGGYPQLLAMDLFESWHRNVMPHTIAEQQLAIGLRVAYAWGADCEQAVAFFRRACEVAQRVINDDKLSSPECQPGFPRNRGALYRAYSYARAILGERLDVVALRQASRDFEEWCKGYGKREWDSQAQANYLAAVRLALTIGDMDRARELLNTKKSFKWHKAEHELWKRVVELSGADLRTDAGLGEPFVEYFDKLRDPRFVPGVYMETDILRPELAAIRDKYLVSNDGAIDWARAIDSVPGS